MKTTKEQRFELRLVSRIKDKETYRAEHNIILQLLDDIDTLSAENAAMRRCLEYIVRRGYTGAEFVARECLASLASEATKGEK